MIKKGSIFNRRAHLLLLRLFISPPAQFTKRWRPFFSFDLLHPLLRLPPIVLAVLLLLLLNGFFFSLSLFEHHLNAHPPSKQNIYILLYTVNCLCASLNGGKVSNSTKTRQLYFILKKNFIFFLKKKKKIRDNLSSWFALPYLFNK